MQTLKPAKEGSEVKSLLCYACLTSDRKLFVLKKCAAEYREIWTKIVQGVSLDVSLCWECLALLRNVKKFQEKVKISQTVLKETAGDQKYLLNNLSNLSTTEPTITSYFSLVTIENKEHQIEILEKNIETEFEINQEDDQISDEFNLHDDLFDEIKEDLENAVENSRQNEPENDSIGDTKNTIDSSSNDFINLKTEPLQDNETPNTNKINLPLEKKERRRKRIYLLNNLSNLSTSEPTITSYFSLVTIENKEQQIEILEKNIETEFEIKQEDDQISDEFNLHDDLFDEIKEDLENAVDNSRQNEPENDSIGDTKNTIDSPSNDFINLKTEPLQDNETPNTNKINLPLEKKERRKRVRGNKKKYKVEHVNVYRSLTRVTISPVDVNKWFEKERNSRFFKAVQSKCVQCAMRITKKNFKSHMRLHAQILNFTCDVCKRSFEQKKYLIHHIRHHNNLWSCNMCDFKSIRREHVMNHLSKEHSRVVKCLECDETFRSVSEFRPHYDQAHRFSRENFFCDYCNKKFGQKRVVRNHIIRYHLSQRCTDCGRTFPNLYRLNYHKKMMHHIDRSEATYCVQCDKQFDNKDLFTRHFSSYAVHAGERKQRKKATCPACGKVYAKSSNMKNHYNKEHVEVPRFRCVECDKSFVNNCKLKEHNKYVHQGFVKKRDKMCAYCGRGFTDLKILKQHIRRHTGERPYKCPHCGSTFAQRTAMVTHVKNIHNKKKLKQ